MKKLLLPILGTAAFIIAVGLLIKNTSLTKGNFNQTESTSKTVTVGSTTFKVEVADTPAERGLGLGKRSSLAEGVGMLFVFDQKGGTANFWMKDMQFPIDIIWIKDGKVVKIDKNVANQPGASDSELKIYSAGSVDYVLELNAGAADKANISVGEAVDLSKAL